MLQDSVSTLGGAGNSNPESEQQTSLSTVFSEMAWEPNACIKTGNVSSTKRALLLHLVVATHHGFLDVISVRAYPNDP